MALGAVQTEEEIGREEDQIGRSLRRADEIDFGQLPDFIGYHLRKAYGVLFQSFREMLKDLGLAPGQYSVLTLISLNPGVSQMAIADATGIDRSTAVPIINRFVKLGWVRRTRRKSDRRLYSLRLTPAGEEVLSKAQPIIREHEEQLVGMLSSDERTTLLDLLKRMNAKTTASAADGASIE